LGGWWWRWLLLVADSVMVFHVLSPFWCKWARWLFGRTTIKVVALGGRLCDGPLCFITFLMQMSKVVVWEDDDEGGCSWWQILWWSFMFHHHSDAIEQGGYLGGRRSRWLLLLVDCVMVFYVSSPFWCNWTRWLFGRTTMKAVALGGRLCDGLLCFITILMQMSKMYV
jgi:hypothetical protein